MPEAEHFSDAITGLLSNPENGWFTPASIALEGITTEQANLIPAEGFNSIGSIVAHMSYWQEFMICRLRGEAVEDLQNDPRRVWSGEGHLGNDEAWKTLCDRLFRTNKELADVVKRFSDSELQAPYMEGRAKRYQVIQGIIAHNCYHTNELITIRHMLGLWLERT